MTKVSCTKWQALQKKIEGLETDSRGIILIITGLLSPVLLAFMGLALDVGLVMAKKRHQQKAADAGAMGGAHELWRIHAANVVE